MSAVAETHSRAVAEAFGHRAYDLEEVLEAEHPQGHVYLLHFRTPVAHAKHYIGWAADGGLHRRLAQHEAGNGKSTPLVRAAVKAGGFILARQWDGVTRSYERQLKNRHGAAALCPICKAAR